LTYATIMVCLRLERPNARLLEIAGAFAERFGAGVVGVVTRQPTQYLYSEVYVPSDLIEQDRDDIQKKAEIVEQEFRAALGPRVSDLQWRSMIMFGPLSDYVADEARCADLLLINSDRGGASFDPITEVDVGDLAMRAGRPLLVVPGAIDKLEFKRLVVGWKETREARRAIVDALPLLGVADQVTIVEFADKDELPETASRLEDVVGWLKRHGVTAQAVAAPSTGDDAGGLKAIAAQQGADLIVAGAYGHSRLREWVFGGVTRNLLHDATTCLLISH
jgi:nucleotide-binding universal stress UspA family protein